VIQIIFGSLKTNSVKTKNYEPSSVPYERVISNQELNSLEASDNSGERIQTGTGTILVFQQKADTAAEFEESNLVEGNPEQVTLVKDSFNSGELGKFGPGSKAPGKAKSNPLSAKGWKYYQRVYSKSS